MILEGLIRLFFGLINLVIGMIPEIKIGDKIGGLMTDITYLFSYATYFIPVGTIVTCLGLIFLIDNIKFFMSIINWIIAKIPTIS